MVTRLNEGNTVTAASTTKPWFECIDELSEALSLGTANMKTILSNSKILMQCIVTFTHIPFYLILIVLQNKCHCYPFL